MRKCVTNGGNYARIIYGFGTMIIPNLRPIHNKNHEPDLDAVTFPVAEMKIAAPVFGESRA